MNIDQEEMRFIRRELINIYVKIKGIKNRLNFIKTSVRTDEVSLYGKELKSYEKFTRPHSL